MPQFGKREQRPEMQARRESAQVNRQETTPNREEAVENADEKLKSEWLAVLDSLKNTGALDADGRWIARPDGWSREQLAYVEELIAADKATAERQAEAKLAEPTPEEQDYVAGIEKGRVYTLEVNGEPQDLTYQGDDADGKAIMVTQKGMRLFNSPGNSRGLEGVMQMAEVYPNEFAVTVDKSELSEDKMAA